MATKVMKVTPSLRAYRNLVAVKSKFCSGKVNKTAVKQQASNYKAAAIKAGKPAAEVDKTIRRVLASGCKMSAAIGKRKAAPKRRTTK